jgi:hypothetical protein
MDLKIQVGDTIRAYDFKPMVGRKDCFIEGKVVDTYNTEMGFHAYKVVVTRDSWEPEGEKGRAGIEMFVPHRVSFMEFAGRVINLSR